MKKLISLSEKIFISGANGMVGSSIVRSLIRNGYGNKKHYGELLTPSRNELDLTNYEDLSNWFQGNKPSVVIVAAAKVGGILANATKPLYFLLENLKIQTNLIELSFLNKVKRLLFLGSSCIYPKYAEQPIKEDSLLTGALENTNEWYAIAKISGIKLCEALRIQEGFDAISLMPTNLYGPGDNYHYNDSHVMAALIRKFYEAKINNQSSVICWGTGEPLREFLHVDDLGEAVTFVLENWYPKKITNTHGSTFNNFLNVGTGKDISIRDLAFKIAKIMDFKGEIIWDSNKPNGTPKKQLDISKISKLGWQPKINLDTGLEQTIISFQEDYKKGRCRL